MSEVAATKPTEQPQALSQSEPRGSVRWAICSLLFFAATVNYADRNIISLLKPTLQAQYHWSEIDYSNIILAFQLAYAIGTLVVGRVIDWLGTRKGFSLSVIVWSLASMSHALARTVFGFGSARFVLGLGESGNFPAAIKTIAEWFPKRERALATGIFNSGTNLGAMLVPLVIPGLVAAFGWQSAFIAIGLLDFVWLALWLSLYRRPEEHPRVSADELAYIRSDAFETVTPVRWVRLMGYRQTWAFAIAKFLTDPIWWLYLFWIPDFLHRNHGVDLKGMFLPITTVYTAATAGSISGGWLSSALIKRGWRIHVSRRAIMLLCAVAVTPIVIAARTHSLWVAVLLVAVAAAAHQGWSANLYTTASDTFPRSAVGSVVGIGSMAGAVGGMLVAKLVGYVLEWTRSYLPVFILAGTVYLCALFIMHLLSRDGEPVRLEA